MGGERQRGRGELGEVQADVPSLDLSEPQFLLL